MEADKLANPLSSSYKSNYHLKVFFKSEANLLDCLELVKALKTNDLVNKAIFCLGKKLESEASILRRLRLAQAKLRKKCLDDTADILEALNQRQTDNHHLYGGKTDEQLTRSG